MAYQVTARKYRPQSFAELIGQDHVRLTLQNALRKGRVAHAYLFSGPRGVGKTTVARLLAKAVNCEARARSEAAGGPLPDDPCNQCASCREIVEDRHPDVLEIDGASNTGVENIRDLREQVRYAPARGRCKVYVIDEVHMLSKGAFNALLKTLEEPPPGVLFVFATTEPERIPPTISSRCQCFDFHRFPPSLISEQLTRIAEGEGIAVEKAAIRLLARTAEGSMRDAQGLFDQVVAFTAGREGGGPLTEAEVSEVLGLVGGSVLWKVAGRIAAGDARGLLEAARDIFLEGRDVKQFCLALLAFFRDLLVAGAVEDPSGLLERTPEEVEEFRALAREFGREKLHRCFRMTMEVERDVRQATSPQPILEMSLMRMAGLRPGVPLEAVLEKLRSVEAALGRTDSSPPEPPALGRETPPSGGVRAARETAPALPAGGPSAPAGPGAVAEEVTAPPTGDQGDLWQRLIQEVGAVKEIAAHYLVGGRFVSVHSGEIRIGVAKPNFPFAERHKQVMMQAARRIWGEGSRVVLVPVAPPEEPPEAEAANGGPPARPAEGDVEVRLIEQVLRDAEEIFGNGGEAGGTP